MAAHPVEFVKAALLEVQEYVGMLGKFLRGVTTRPFYYRDVIEQFEAIGVGSLTVVVLTGMFTGMVLALQSGMTLDQFGARSMVGRLVSASMVKELGPVLTGLMVILFLRDWRSAFIVITTIPVALLSAAGFHVRTPQTPVQKEIYNALPAYRVERVSEGNKVLYVQ